jgi:hypothetical protein
VIEAGVFSSIGAQVFAGSLLATIAKGLAKNG